MRAMIPAPVAKRAGRGSTPSPFDIPAPVGHSKRKPRRFLGGAVALQAAALALGSFQTRANLPASSVSTSAL
jgi:hypothetical protein